MRSTIGALGGQVIVGTCGSVIMGYVCSCARISCACVRVLVYACACSCPVCTLELVNLQERVQARAAPITRLWVHLRVRTPLCADDWDPEDELDEEVMEQLAEEAEAQFRKRNANRDGFR